MVKLQKLPDRDSTFVTVPKDLRKAMGWEKGDQLEFSVKDSETLEIKKA
ncbi:MAG: AbrB/MazE/SpoVT family DNA-binding domain-containing protein [Candidatus Nanohaloarchaea archaeon]